MTYQAVNHQISISDEELEQLRIEAGAAGDEEQVELCDRALDGDRWALAKCAVVIFDALAQKETA